MAGAAGVEGRPQVGGRRRDGSWVVAGDHVHELPGAGELGVDERPRAFADVAFHAGDRPCGPFCHAVNCGCIGVWHAWPQKDGDSIQCSAP